MIRPPIDPRQEKMNSSLKTDFNIVLTLNILVGANSLMNFVGTNLQDFVVIDGLNMVG